MSIIQKAGIVIICAILFFASWKTFQNSYHHKVHMTQNTAQKYLLRMEENGFLTDIDKDCLTEELQKIGINEISYEGSTLSNTGENVVRLVITGETSPGIPIEIRYCIDK